MKDLSKLSIWLQTQFGKEASNPFSLKLRLLRWVCQRWFLIFCVAVKSDFIPTKFHTYLANELQRFYLSVKNGTDERMMIECQPQIGKSTIASELFPAWILGKEAWPIIVASYGASLAEVKSSNCRDIVNGEVYKMIFPKTLLHPETAAKDYWKTTSGGSYRAVGVGGPLTGNPGKILIGDDLFKDAADAESATVREGTHTWWKKVFYTRKQSKSGMMVINTRWHLDDVSGRLIQVQEQHEANGTDSRLYDQWKRLRFPAFAEDDEYINGELFRKKGEVLCPERFTKEDMEKTKNGMDTTDWSSLYMQNPILAENAEFKKEWFRYFEESEIRLKELTYLTLVDLAISQKQAADNTVVRTIAVERSTGYWYLIEETAGHLDPLETVDAVFFHAKTYRSHVWIESVAYQAALPKFIMEKQRKDRVFFNVDELKHTKGKSKEARIRGLIARYKAGVIFHRRSDKDLETELLQFPKGRHDDRIDCLAFALEVAEGAMPSETPKEKQRREKEEAVAFDPFASITKI